MGLSIRNFFSLAANFAVTSSTALVDVTGFTTPLAAGQKKKFRFYLPIDLDGTASGAKFRVIVPAGVTLFVQTNLLIDLVTATPVFFAGSTITVPADFGATLNVAGNHVAIIEGSVVNGVNAGVLKLQFAQNVSNGSAATILAGASMETEQFS